MEPIQPVLTTSPNPTGFFKKASSKVASLFKKEQRDPRCFMGTLHRDVYLIILNLCSIKALGRMERVNKHTAKLVNEVYEEKAQDWGWKKSYNTTHKIYISQLFFHIESIWSSKFLSKKVSNDDRINSYFKKIHAADLHKLINNPNFYRDLPCSWGLINLIKKAGRFKVDNPHTNQNTISISAALSAIECGHISIINYFLKHGLDPNAFNEEGRLLHKAVDCRSMKITALLVNAGAQLDSFSKGYTPLQVALGADRWMDSPDLALLTFLLDSKASPNFVHFGYFPIHLATLLGSFEAVQLLMSRGVPVNQLTSGNITPLAIACGAWSKSNNFKKNPALVKFLLENGADIRIPDEKGQFPFNHASKLNDAEIFTHLIQWHAISGNHS